MRATIFLLSAKICATSKKEVAHCPTQNTILHIFII
jgi:hypothetical protein